MKHAISMKFLKRYDAYMLCKNVPTRMAGFSSYLLLINLENTRLKKDGKMVAKCGTKKMIENSDES